MGANYCGEGGVNERQHLQKYPTADDTVMADQEDSGSWSKHRAGRCGMDEKSYLHFLGHSVPFSTFRGAIFCQYIKWRDSFMLGAWSPWSDLEYFTGLVNDWLTDWFFLLLFYYIILYNAKRNLGLLKPNGVKSGMKIGTITFRTCFNDVQFKLLPIWCNTCCLLLISLFSFL